MNQNSLFLILAAPACAWVSGMGLFKTLLVLIIMHRWVPDGELSGPLTMLGTDKALYVIGFFAFIETVVDFIPRWDVQWDRWNAWPRIMGAGVITWLFLYNQDTMSRVIMVTVGMALAITSFTAKTSSRRAAIKGGTAVFVAPIASITENCMIFATLLPLTRLPPMTLLMVAFMGMAAMLIIYVIRPEVRETFAWLFRFQWTTPVRRDPKPD